MELLTSFLVGVGTGVFITWFPGMLNMQAVATSVRVGKRRAYLFSAGLATVIGGQTILAVLFADVLTGHPRIIPAIKEWAIPLFLLLAMVFTWKGIRTRQARKADVVRPYKGGPFWRGMMMSLMNVLNIPFIFALAGFLMSGGFLSGEFLPRLVYVPGTTLGAFMVFLLYARLAGWVERNMALLTRNINFFIGGLFVVLAVVQAVRIYKS